MTSYHCIYNLVILMIFVQGAFSITYQVIDKTPDTPGGSRFEKEIGVQYTTQTMGTINEFIYKIFDQQNNPDDRRPQDSVQVFIENYDAAYEAVTSGNVINVSSVYIQEYEGDIKWDFTSLLYHEMTHVFQWMPGDSPSGLIEGIADYTILVANYYPPTFAKPGDGDRWDQGYDVTARFLEYCESLLGGFVAQLNKKMKDSYSESYFVDLLGKPVDALWQDYKNKYNKS